MATELFDVKAFAHRTQQMLSLRNHMPEEEQERERECVCVCVWTGKHPHAACSSVCPSAQVSRLKGLSLDFLCLARHACTHTLFLLYLRRTLQRLPLIQYQVNDLTPRPIHYRNICKTLV